MNTRAGTFNNDYETACMLMWANLLPCTLNMPCCTHLQLLHQAVHLLRMLSVCLVT